jgi:hypothetical protein
VIIEQAGVPEQADEALRGALDQVLDVAIGGRVGGHEGGGAAGPGAPDVVGDEDVMVGSVVLSQNWT